MRQPLNLGHGTSVQAFGDNVRPSFFRQRREGESNMSVSRVVFGLVALGVVASTMGCEASLTVKTKTRYVENAVVREDTTAWNGQPIELRLRSKDVLHSFFMPALRIKQDSVPGMQIPLRFQAEQVGNYEIACAELCGLGHYRMRGMLQVMEPAAYAAWLQEQAAAAHP